jgi:hypothetical protein
MAFRLRRRESVGHGLRRWARNQLRSAAIELRPAGLPTDESIHEAPKSVKKARALVQLIEAGVSIAVLLCGARERAW